MDFQDFINQVVDCIPEYLLQYEIDKIHIEQVHKNNGIICTGMAICLKGESITPNIYLEYFYNLYKGGQNMEDVLGLIRDEYNQAHNNIITKSYNDLSENNLDECLFLKLVNYEKNKDMLADCPHIRFLDLAITFRFLVRKDEEGIASAIIRNKDMESWSISEEELYKIGKENGRKLFKPSITPLENILSDILDGIETADCYGIQVLTNDIGINGAIYMAYEDILKEYADSIDSDLYILPSSIHEVLLLPYDEEIKKGDLASMVKDINEYVVDDMDFLSDEVYLFTREKGFVIE